MSAAETTGPGKASVATVAIVGGGVIGAGWIGRYLHRGADVRVFDPDPEAERKINDVLANAESAFEMLYGVAPVKGALSYHSALGRCRRRRGNRARIRAGALGPETARSC